MHTVELLDEAVQAARRLGYEVRQDWLGGDGGKSDKASVGGDPAMTVLAWRASGPNLGNDGQYTAC